jgi:hypothetical protein
MYILQLCHFTENRKYENATKPINNTYLREQGYGCNSISMLGASLGHRYNLNKVYFNTIMGIRASLVTNRQQGYGTNSINGSQIIQSFGKTSIQLPNQKIVSGSLGAHIFYKLSNSLSIGIGHWVLVNNYFESGIYVTRKYSADNILYYTELNESKWYQLELTNVSSLQVRFKLK